MILAIIGTRPQILKVDPNTVDVVVNTSQHYDDELAGQYFRERKIKPKYNLGLSSDETGLMIDKLRKILQKEKPDKVLVYGDTNSTLAGSIAAAYENIPFGHVEAGVRSGDTSMLEEINRIVADRLATYRFCPDLPAYDNLLKEGLEQNTMIVGDSLFDTLIDYLPIRKRKDKGQYIFASIHRRENMNENLVSIFNALERTNKKVYFSLHPHTKRVIKKLRIKVGKNIEIIKPQNRKKTLEYISNAHIVVSDSGGVLRESYWCLVPCVVPRTITEWDYIRQEGWAAVVGANEEKILSAIMTLHPTTQPQHFPKQGANEKIKYYLSQ